MPNFEGLKKGYGNFLVNATEENIDLPSVFIALYLLVF